MSTWTINNATFASQSLGNLQRNLSNQTPDLVSFTAEGSSFTGDPLFAENSTITIKKDGVLWFTGRIIQVPRLGAAGEESITYKAAGPWHDLERHVFKQTWKLWNAATSTVTDQYKSRVILGQTAAGAAQTSGATITEILNYAIDNGVLLTIGTISPSINIPWTEAVDITCAEALRTVLRWTPDAVCYFDYSAAIPVFHCQLRSQLTPVTIDIDAGSPTHRIDIQSRPDLQVPAVVIRYEKTDTYDGTPYQSVSVDKYPPSATGNELNAVNMTIELAGSNLTMQTSKITVEALPADLDNALTWWAARIPELADPSIDNAVISDSQRVGHVGGYYANELIKGSIETWMGAAEQDVISAVLQYEILDITASDVHTEIVNKLISYSFVATDLTSKTYKRTDSFSAGEAIPTGIAEAYYNSVNPLQYEGDIVFIATEIPGTIGFQNVLNLSNGQAAWATMKALIQSISENVDEGTTTISFGPADHLGPADLIELLRCNRGRKISGSWQARNTGLAQDASSTLVEEDAFTPNSKAILGGGTAKHTTYRDTGSTYTASITVNPALVTEIKDDDDVDIRPREIDICVDGEAKKMIIMASEPYDP